MDEFEKQQQERPAQHQPRQPGREGEMQPQPIFIRESYRGSGKLEGQVALITGGDSGIGRAAAVHFAREGADVAIVYLDEHDDAEQTRRLIEAEGRRCRTLSGDVGDEEFCRRAVADTLDTFGRLDVLVNNAGEQHAVGGLEEISAAQLERTFRTDLFGCVFMAKPALPHLEGHGRIINTTSVTAYRGHEQLLDYSSAKGAIVSLTRSLARSVVGRGIRVNGVAPGPIWTPLIPATFPADKVESFGGHTPMGRAGQPAELGPAYVYLGCEDSSYMTGQVLHLNGGDFIET